MRLEAAGHGGRMVEHSSIHWGKARALREWLKCFSILICKGQIITELAILKPEAVSLHGGGGRGVERGRAGIKSLPFREKKKRGENLQSRLPFTF